jgi:hypothetical protein
MKSSKKKWMQVFLAAALALPAFIAGNDAREAFSAQTTQRAFPETGKSVQGQFLEYWNKNGGLPQQGFPISEEMQERSDTDGKTYTVQYFERAVFELHPENAAPNDVLLSLLGVFLYNQKYPNGAPGQTPNNGADSRLFAETGKRVGGAFLSYWNKNGGLAQQGFPISDEFTEVSDLDGKSYKVQFFQRAVFELHPENRPPYDVLLSQLGTFRYRAKHLQPAPTATRAAPTAAPATPVPPTAEPTATQPPTGGVQPVPQPADFAAVRAKFENMTPDEWRAAGYTRASPGFCESGIGFRLMNATLWQESYDGNVSAMNPPNILLNGKRERIVGLQWIVKGSIQPAPVLFGQQMPLTVGPGGEPAYLFFAFFKPDGYVHFARQTQPDPCSQ